MARIDDLKEEGKSFKSIAIKYEWPSMRPLGQNKQAPFGTFYTIVKNAEINQEQDKDWYEFDPSDAEIDEATGLLKTIRMRPMTYRKIPSRFSFGETDALYRQGPGAVYDIYFSYNTQGALNRLIACKRVPPDSHYNTICEFETKKGELRISFFFEKEKYMKHWKGIERDIFRIVNLD
ncbi:hypothetical protein [Roseibium sp. RKSG952]|uniref:hypothetical protein n=1 Tax=Roseibium sp. RKSG952 TaxID=2529384 RepID=UPI0012BBFB5C|nr:hypothetical protein [Roseibium sp. RKSG952]MTH95897.1 hypothetical protein [Roseibium sp. RKSG952]